MASAGSLVLDDPLLEPSVPVRDSLARAVWELGEARGHTILAAGHRVRALLRAAHRGYLLDAGRVLVARDRRDLRDKPTRRRLLGRQEAPI